jgi:hypothetical protein
MAIQPPGAQWEEPIPSLASIPIQRGFLAYDPVTDEFTIVTTGFTGPAFVLTGGEWIPTVTPAPGDTLGRIAIRNGEITVY